MVKKLNKINHISSKVKIILIRALAGTLRGLASLNNRSPRLVKTITKPLGKIGRFLLLAGILPIYKIYLSVKKLTNKFYAPQKSRHRIVHPFSRRFLTHVIIITITLFTLTANLNAYETRSEDFEKSIAAALITTEDLGSIEEEGPIAPGKKITRYLGQTGVTTLPQVSEGGDGEEILPSTIVGGSAIVRPILSPIEEDLRQRDKIIAYTVQVGDTLSEIAEKFGVTTNTILWQNNLSAYSLIRPGDTLTILPTSGIQHKVASGDTIASIAKKYGIEPENIIEFNKLASADDIRAGEYLILPGGKKIIPQPTYTIRRFTQPVAAPAPKVVSGSGDMIWPTNCRRITQYFRYQHSGLDVACSFGDPVYAADGGTVVEAEGGWNGGYGVMVTIDHGGGKVTLYGHLSSLYIKPGEVVTKGQSIGAMGSTGRSTGPHVHFEVRINGSRQNPLYYIK